jgi:hypothetical protein
MTTPRADKKSPRRKNQPAETIDTMDAQHFLEHHVPKKTLQAAAEALGILEIARQEEMHKKLLDLGRAERIEQAKLECAKRRAKKATLELDNSREAGTSECRDN